MQSWGSLLPYLLYMARDYENEAMGKFLLPSQPDKGNFTSRMAYETALKAYQHDHMHVMEVCERWKQGEWIKDVCREAEVARARAVAEKEGREAPKGAWRHHGLEQGEAEATTSIECCKQ